MSTCKDCGSEMVNIIGNAATVLICETIYPPTNKVTNGGPYYCKEDRPDVVPDIFTIGTDNKYLEIFNNEFMIRRNYGRKKGVQAVVNAVRQDVFANGIDINIFKYEEEIHDLKELLAQMIEHVPQDVISPSNGSVPDWFVEAAFIVHGR